MHRRAHTRLRQARERHQRLKIGIGSRSQTHAGNPNLKGVVDGTEIERTDAISMVMGVDG